MSDKINEDIKLKLEIKELTNKVNELTRKHINIYNDQDEKLYSLKMKLFQIDRWLMLKHFEFKSLKLQRVIIKNELDKEMKLKL